MNTDTQDQLLPVIEDGTSPILYENESLDTLLGTLPKTLGLMKNPLTYTCFDVSKDYLAAGTNLGLVCMYSFLSQNMQFIQNRSDPITHVLIDSYRKWVAMGDKQGAVSMFNFNKEMLFSTQEKSHNPVTCLAWGKESNIIFSGYSSGKIIVSHFQSEKNSLYSKVLMESGPSLFQMSYHRGVLLASNHQRSFLMRVGADLIPEPIVNIGSKDRKLGMYGATFFQNENNETKIAVARPGFRIWFVSMDGSVESTGKLKDHLFVPGAPSISFMGRTQPSLIPSTELQFTFLQPFQGRYLISWCQNHLWVVDPIELRVLGQTSGLRNVRWAVGDEGDMYIFHDGYQIFRKVSLHSDYLVVEPTLPPANLSTAMAEGEVIQELNCSSNEKQMDLYSVIGIDTDKMSDIRSSPSQDVKTDKLDIQARLKEKLLINDDILQKTKHFFKESVGPILEKTSSTFLRPATPTYSTPTKETDANTSNDSTADNESTALQEEPDQEDQPLAFATKAEQLRRLGTVPLMESDELVVRTIRKKKRHRKKARGPSRANSMSSLITDTTSDLSEQPEIDLISQLAEAADQKACSNEKVTVEEYKDPDDVVVAKDRKNKEDISKLRDSQMEEKGEVKFAFTYLSESSRAIQMRKSVTSEEVIDSRSELTNSNTSQTALVSQNTRDVTISADDTVNTADKPTDVNGTTDDSTLNTSYTATDNTADNTLLIPDTPVSEKHVYFEDHKSEIECIPPDTHTDSQNEDNDSFTEIDIKEVMENIDPKSPSVSNGLVLSENHFTNSKMLSPELESYDVISNTVVMREKENGLSNGDLLDSEDTLNPQYTEKLSRIISRKSRVFSYAPNEFTKLESGVDSSQDGSLLNSHSDMVTSVTMEEELQPSTTRPISGNNWSSYRLPFSQTTKSLAVSDAAIWAVEEGKGNVYWCKTKSVALNWVRVAGMTAEQISTSYNGLLVLVVSKENHLFTRRGITENNPSGKTWHKLHDGITHISCGPTTFWAISFTGDVLFSNHADPVTFKVVPSVVRYKQIASSDSITVALGADNIVYLRTGITAVKMCGDAWRPVTRFEVSNVSICLTTVWAVSTEGRVYFNPELRMSRTTSTRTALEADQSWFQVMLRKEQLNETSKRNSGYMPRLPLMFTYTHNAVWPSLSRMPGSSKLSYCLPTYSLAVGYETNYLISSSIMSGVWVLSGKGTQKLYHCHSHIIGVKYLPISERDEMGSPFVSVSAGYAAGDQGVRSDHIWALKANGGLVCFDSTRKRSSIPPDRSMEMKSVSTCENCLWCCDLDNKCWIRSQITSNAPLGMKWISPDMGNLEGELIHSISCGLLSMWAVSTKGEVWLRFGSSPTLHNFEKTLSPVWLRLSSDCSGESVLMKQVIVGPGDWKVWAISLDSRVYIRKGITRYFPIGDKWELVPDMLAIEIALSVYHVWVLDPTGSLHLRLGVSQMNPVGNYWKPVLGRNLKKITVTPYGQLWCIDENGELLCRLEKNYLENDLVSSCVSVANNPQVTGWEVL